MMPPTPRTAIRDVTLANCSATIDDEAVLDALVETTVDATEAACLSSDRLLDWDEYREVAL